MNISIRGHPDPMNITEYLNEKTGCLKNLMITDWEKFISSLDSEILDTNLMRMPSNKVKLDEFWWKFCFAIEKAKKLKCIKLYRCPAYIVERIISTLPQLTVLTATSIKGDADMSVEEYGNGNHFDIMTLSLCDLDRLIHLTELRIKGLGSIQLTNMPSFENLVSLKCLSMTSFRLCSKMICNSLKTVTTNLESLEIGDCDSFNKDFPEILKRFINLVSIRFEMCFGTFKEIAGEVFSSIRSLDKLKSLQLINIDLNNNVLDKLELCSGIKVLMVIPLCITKTPNTTSHLIHCLKKLSSTLTHLIWGTTEEFLTITDLFITTSLHEEIPHDIELLNELIAANNIRITRSKIRLEKDNIKDHPIIHIIPVSTVEKLLKTLMKNTKVKVFKTTIEFATCELVHKYLNE